MTCTHVLGLIDAGPFADYPRAHLDAAWQHARQCATCGPALEAATTLTADLPALPQPAPPPDLTAAVLARIARIDIDQVHSAPATAAMPETTARCHTRDWSAAAAFGGLAAGLAIVLSMPPPERAPIHIASPRVSGMAAGLGAPSTTTEAVVLAGGLVLYVAGLFAPLGGRSRP